MPPAATAEPEKAERKKIAPRPYRISQTVRLDLTDPESVASTLQKLLGEDATIATVDVRIGVGQGLTPKAGLESYGADNDLSGDYDVVAEKSVTTFQNVSTKQKRAVSIGG